jgi:hypothetical protein
MEANSRLTIIPLDQTAQTVLYIINVSLLYAMLKYESRVLLGVVSYTHKNAYLKARETTIYYNSRLSNLYNSLLSYST